ncbi:hypothetical protein ACS0TY_005302 [Phlomoides rotata]
MVCNDCSSSVAKEFVKQYYFILENCLEKLHKFYKEPSLLSWPGVNAPSVVQPAKTTKAPSVVALATSVKAPLIVAPTTNVKTLSTVAPETNSNARFVIASTTNNKIPSTLASTINPIVTSNITPASNSALKFSYASMLVKEASTTSPKIAIVTLSVDNQMLAPPTTKASIPLGTGSPKTSNHSGNVSKSFMSSRNIAPKIPTSAHGAPNVSPYAEAKGIYIGGLPFDITKQGVVDAVKKFGPVRNNPNTIQIMRHEDGFCCGFVEFESTNAAHRAVKLTMVEQGLRHWRNMANP